MAKTPQKKTPAKPQKADPFAQHHNSSIYKSDFAKMLALVGSGPKAPKVKKVDQKGQLIKGTPWAVKDIIALLRNTAHGVKSHHPRSSGRMFSDIAQSSRNGDPVIEGYGAGPGQIGIDNDWWYPGGAPPGYPEPGPKDTLVIMESGTIFGTGGRQPWTDPGYPTKQDLETDPPDDDDDKTPDTGEDSDDDDETDDETETP